MTDGLFIGSCAECRFWTKHGADWLDVQDKNQGVCARETQEGALFFTMPGQGAQTAELITEPDFGCVQWERQ